MADMAQLSTKWNEFREKIRPGFQKTARILKKGNRNVSLICTWIYRLRGVFMAIPVVVIALKLAAFNSEYLPEQVGLKLLSSGEFSQIVERATAVNVPVILTFSCLGLMLCSRRPLYPWLISIFTLIFPLLILATNHFEALLILFAK